MKFYCTYKTCSKNNMSVVDFDHTHPPAYLPASKLNNPTRYLQHKRKLWAEAQQVQTYYLTKRAVYLAYFAHWKSKHIHSVNLETLVRTYLHLNRLYQ